MAKDKKKKKKQDKSENTTGKSRKKQTRKDQGQKGPSNSSTNRRDVIPSTVPRLTAAQRSSAQRPFAVRCDGARAPTSQTDRAAGPLTGVLPIEGVGRWRFRILLLLLWCSGVGLVVNTAPPPNATGASVARQGVRCPAHLTSFQQRDSTRPNPEPKNVDAAAAASSSPSHTTQQNAQQ
ncbi:hypothetical protein BKA80DRAFT_123536 [Phyllosticta citrichinensis]